MTTDDVVRGPELVRDLVQLAEVLAGGADVGTKLSELCASAVRTIGCDRSSIFVMDRGRFRARCNHGNPPDIAAAFPSYVVSPADPLIARAVETRSYVIVNDAGNDPLMDPRVAEMARINAIVVVPLFAGDEAAGFMTAEYNERPGSFSELGSSLLLGLAKLGETVLRAERNAAERAELRHRLDVAARLDAVSRLAAGVAHDLNNQLAVIVALASVVRERNPGRDIDRLLDAAESSYDIGRRLLQVGRGLPLEPLAALDVSAVVTGLADRLGQFVPDHVLRFDVQPGLLVACSPSDVEQTLTNLVLNASDAAPPGSEIAVTVTAPETAGGGRAVEISVRDRGSGIEPDVIDRVFEPFFTTKGPGSGTGLGLSSVRSIARSVGGEVRVESRPGEGSTFTVQLPLVEPQGAERSGEGRPQRLVVLVVDDQPMVLEATAGLLAAAGHEVHTAASAEEALRDGALLDSIDALVTDATMPGMSGLELARRVRERRADLPVVIVSGLPPPPDRPPLPGTGPVTDLAKPYRADQLIAALAGTPPG